MNDRVFTRVTPEKVAEIVAEYRGKAADDERQDIVTTRNELTYASIQARTPASRPPWPWAAATSSTP